MKTWTIMKALWHRGRRWLRRPTTGPNAYAQWMQRRLEERQLEYRPYPDPKLFSILTAVFDPPVSFLRELGRSVLQQDFSSFEWILVDNASRDPVVLDELDRLAQDRRVRVYHSGYNRGILGGLRLALNKATHRYIVPVDHDDRLYPDALRVAAAVLQENGYPPLLYTDEDKLLPDGSVDHPFCKPDWDPLLFCNCCYTAHLGVMDRLRAGELACYTDEEAQGCPDWDAFSRFVAEGDEPVHCPEIVYSWRMHPASTATPGQNAKPYTVQGQRHLLQRFLRDQGLASTLTIEPNPLYGDAGMWRIAHRPSKRHDAVIIPWDRSWESLERTYRQAAQSEWIEWRAAGVRPMTQAYQEEVAALLAFDPRIAAVAPTLVDDDGRILSAGMTWGLGGVLGASHQGKPRGDFGGYGALINQHRVGAVDDRWCFLRSSFFLDVYPRFKEEDSPGWFAAWLAAQARMADRWIAFTPHVAGQWPRGSDWSEPTEAEAMRFLSRYGMLLLDDPTYSRCLRLEPDRAYELATAADRRRVLERILQPWLGTMEVESLLRQTDMFYGKRRPYRIQQQRLPSGQAVCMSRLTRDVRQPL